MGIPFLGPLVNGVKSIPGKLAGGKKPDADAVGYQLDQPANEYTDPEKFKHLAEYYPVVDERDAKVADKWIKRHPEMIRLTGSHPFNAEPPLPTLLDYGFISPVNLHIVRDHGAVPKLDWNTHTVTVKGNVDKPLTLSMDDLVKMESISFPCLVTCAGNRRKEQNQIKRSIGFNWGPAACAVTHWTGVPLYKVLNAAGITKPGPGRRFVCFAGPKSELPKSYEGQQGGPGSYGTSIDMETALDPSCDVILAYKQNGEHLHPDHGYPLRLLIPGYIGGRMVKWLSEIEVTGEESNNFYHFNDNRVLPAHVDAEKANEEGWWFKPEYIINDLNINGAVGYPWHNETLKVDPSEPFYTIKGYAYSGGGRRVIRVEISLDGGMSWALADVTERETPRWAANSSGARAKHWCWCFWEHTVKVEALAGSAEICMRAWDQTQNSMPERPTWNVMGMLNNPWYRVRVHPQPGNMLKFEHPTQAGPDKKEGWMVNMANNTPAAQE
eukprot:CAMPEP_0118935022 /NCGR_PEP_ID=MMETSP1169-20130426/14724_1 /TAXON_ID=36882 /ORGANISM="Pyramimonas obovata, Strain CCMP722" /LENGTH=495 /DNA_ID=CAMNT_0006878003 /DNA_START=123 /DNA_END=1607 /DNA_ORIENTATION=+